jgi:hypothetical protein
MAIGHYVECDSCDFRIAAPGGYAATTGEAIDWWNGEAVAIAADSVAKGSKEVTLGAGESMEFTYSNDELQAAIDSLIEAIKIEPMNRPIGDIDRHGMLDKLMAEQYARIVMPVRGPITAVSKEK